MNTPKIESGCKNVFVLKFLVLQQFSNVKVKKIDS